MFVSNMLMDLCLYVEIAPTFLQLTSHSHANNILVSIFYEPNPCNASSGKPWNAHNFSWLLVIAYGFHYFPNHPWSTLWRAVVWLHMLLHGRFIPFSLTTCGTWAITWCDFPIPIWGPRLKHFRNKNTM